MKLPQLPAAKLSYVILIILVLVSLLINIRMSFHRDSVLIFIKQVGYDGDMRRVYLSTGLDKFLASVNPPGNVVLKFRGFGKLARESDTDVSLMIYFRSVYALYPRKVFAVPENVKVNTGEDMSANPFDPKMKWMQNNRVSTVITFTQIPGSIYNKVVSIPLIETVKPDPKENP